MLFSKKYITVLLFVFCCCQNNDSLPIPEATLLKVLSDIHKAEVIINGETQVQKDSLSRRYYQQIFDKHGITAAQYDTTLSMLSFRPAMMHRIYDQVMKNYQEENNNLTKANNK
jgi:hypothetical protein